MKIALKYGLAVTLVIAGWVALKHFVLHLESQPAQIADVVIFNLAAITGLTLGIREADCQWRHADVWRRIDHRDQDCRDVRDSYQRLLCVAARNGRPKADATGADATVG